MNIKELFPELSDRQFTILKMVAHGHTNQYIGLAEAISERTVEYHVSNLIEIFGGHRMEYNERVLLAATFFKRVMAAAHEAVRG